MRKTFSGRKPSQDQWEFTEFLSLLGQFGVRKYLEIGAREGDTFHAVGRMLPRGSTMVAVDLPGGKWGYDKSKDQLWAAGMDLTTQYGHRVRVEYGDSGSQDVLDCVRAFGPYDAILIDGDHRYEGVSRDWNTYGHMAPLVAFHDIAGHGVVQRTTKDPVEVPRLWEELKAQYRTVEFVTPGSAMGIGVVFTQEKLK